MLDVFLVDCHRRSAIEERLRDERRQIGVVGAVVWKFAGLADLASAILVETRQFVVFLSVETSGASYNWYESFNVFSCYDLLSYFFFSLSEIHDLFGAIVVPDVRIVVSLGIQSCLVCYGVFYMVSASVFVVQIDVRRNSHCAVA